MSTSLLRLAVVNNSDPDVQRILHHYRFKGKAAPSATYETTMLHEACRAGSINVIDTLLTLAEVDVNKLEPKLMGGASALHLACNGGHTDIVRKLISAGADVNSISNNSMKETPLHVCCKLNRLDCCSALLAAGADTTIRDGFGHSASYWANIKKHNDLIQAAGLPPPVAATAKDTLALLSQRCKTTVFIKPPGKVKKKKGKKGEKKNAGKRKK